MLPSAVPTFGMLMGEAAAYLGITCMMPTAPLGFLLALVQQRFLIALGRDHQVIEAYSPAYFWKSSRFV